MPSVIVDTSVWVRSFRSPDSPEKTEVERLLVEGDGVMVGPVYTELLRGARDEDQFRLLEDRLQGMPFLEASRDTWRRAGRLLFDLRRQGLTIPLADALIAALALEHQCHVYSMDEHFRMVPGLKLHAEGS